MVINRRLGETLLDYMPYTKITSARELGRQEWYNNVNDPRCPHDAWVEHILIKETPEDKSQQPRALTIEIRLLNAFHNGYLLFLYTGVQSYSFNMLRAYTGSHPHSDWLEDWLHAENREKPHSHQIRFASGTFLTIIFDELIFESAWDEEKNKPENVG